MAAAMKDAPPPLAFGPEHPYKEWGFSDCPVCGRPPSRPEGVFPWTRPRGSYHLFRDERSAIAFHRTRLCQACQDLKAKLDSVGERRG